jgi:alpha-methylacyl-CoA racemase
MMLADMGAEVIRIARPGQVAFMGLDQKYMLYDRSRQTVELDMRDAKQHAQAQQLIARAEILVEGFRPGVMERLGLGPDQMLAANPALVYGRMTGWGQTGPFADRAGHDLNYMAVSGALWSIGPGDAPPPPPQNIVADLAGGGMMLLAGVLAATLHARSHGRGQVVDACMSDGAALMMVLQYGLKAAGVDSDTPRGAGLLNGGAPWYRCYATADAGYVALGPIEPQFFAVLIDRLGLANDPSFAAQYDPAMYAGMHARLETIFASQPRAYWEELLGDVDACFAPVLSMDEAPNHPQNTDRGTFHNSQGIIQPGPAPRFSATPQDAPTHGDAGKVDFTEIMQRWSP